MFSFVKTKDKYILHYLQCLAIYYLAVTIAINACLQDMKYLDYSRLFSAECFTCICVFDEEKESLNFM